MNFRTSKTNLLTIAAALTVSGLIAEAQANPCTGLYARDCRADPACDWVDGSKPPKDGGASAGSERRGGYCVKKLAKGSSKGGSSSKGAK